MVAATPLIAVEIEQALLGAILCDASVLDRIDGQLVADDFSEARHRRLFEIFVDAQQAGHRIDPRLAIAALGPDAATQVTPELTAAQYVARLASEAINTQSAKSYAHSIREMADRRWLVELADRIKVGATSARPVSDLAVEAIEDLDTIASMQTASHLAAVDVGAAAERLVESMTVRMQNPGALTGISTGLADLDAKTGGYHRGELTILAGRPGMGKSAFGVSSSRQSAAQVHYFSLEMTAEALTARALTDAIFDHRDPVVTEVSAGLKALAKDLDVAVVALAQLNRAVENRDDKRPNLSDLRESGSIEQDADLVLLLFREAYYLDRPCPHPADEDARVARLEEVRNKLEIDIAKARNGPTGIVPVFFDVATNAIRSWSRAA